MAQSWNAAPRVTQFDEADITALDELRKKHADGFEKKGARLTLTCFALKMVAAALKKHPVFNTSLDEAAGELVWKEYIHIGLAVDTEQGLIVPVLRDVDKKSLLALSKELGELAAKTRDRKVSLEELQGGSLHHIQPGRHWRRAFHADCQHAGSGHPRPGPGRAEAGGAGAGKSSRG